MQSYKSSKEPGVNMAIFASGQGTNAEKIIDWFRVSPSINIALIVSSNLLAGVLKIADREKIPTLVLEKEKFQSTGYISELGNYNINFIVLAGFLWKIPGVLINSFSNRIINIHPALLPSFGGKGMYGNTVHKTVIEAGEKESGITIHYVDDKYDHGEIIFQAKCIVEINDTPEGLAKKIHELEHYHYPKEIEKIVANL